MLFANILLDPYTELTHINSWLYPNNNLLYYVYLVFQTENAAGVVLLLFYKLLSQAHIASVTDHYRVQSQIHPDIQIMCACITLHDVITQKNINKNI